MCFIADNMLLSHLIGLVNGEKEGNHAQGLLIYRRVNSLHNNL